MNEVVDAAWMRLWSVLTFFTGRYDTLDCALVLSSCANKGVVSEVCAEKFGVSRFSRNPLCWRNMCVSRTHNYLFEPLAVT